jgi:hypothetical protein
MCFSAPVSFTAATALIPVGLVTLHQAWRGDRRFLGLAAFPLLFGVQQAFEGLVWLNLGGWHPERAPISALGFLFFVYLVWPMLVPLAARGLESRPRHRLTLLGLGLAAGGAGAFVFLPLLLNAGWLEVSVVKRSILYHPRLLVGEQFSEWAFRIGYALIVTLPLLTSALANVRLFGGLVALSLILSALYFDHAFTSVWCFFAALLSLFILRLVRLDARTAPPGVRSAPTHAQEASRP